MSIFGQNGAIDRIGHRRILMFWTAVVTSLLVPWFLKGCALLPSQTIETHKSCSVLSVHDGDTMTVSCGRGKVRVRLNCIDSPELAQGEWGKQSRDYLLSITPDTVHVRFIARDRYGRYIGEIFSESSDGHSLSWMMVEAGQAAVYKKYCSDPIYDIASSNAKLLKLGIWRVNGLHQKPWLWRAENRK